MKFTLLSHALILSLATLISAQSSANSSGSLEYNDTVYTLVYGYPLLAFDKLASILLEVTNGSNALYHSRDLATAATRVVVAPNVDTLYSVGIFDLSQHDVEVTIPSIPASQFALFSFYDVYGDNFANVGTGNVAQQGTYLLTRPVNGSFGDIGVFRQTPASSRYVASVVSPTTYGILLIRMLVNSTNLDAVHGYQDGTALLAVAFTSPRPTTPSLSGIGPAQSPANQVINDMDRYYYYNLPETSQIADDVDSRFNSIYHLPNGTFNTSAGFDLLQAANTTALAEIAGASANLSNYMPLNNGWNIVQPSLAGTFRNGSDFAFRAAVAFSGFLMLATPNAVYPTWSNTSVKSSSASALTGHGQYLAPNESLIYTFVGGKPPLQSTGFWSLTAYASDGFLIPNSQNVYALGDRSNLTYSDGTLVYARNGTANSTRPFQIVIQAADNPPPANWTKNWIPAPAGGGNVSAALRWYGAEQSLLDGDYQYPVVSRQAAIAIANGSGTTGTMSPTTSSSAMPGVPTGAASSLHVACSGAFVVIWAVVVNSILVF